MSGKRSKFVVRAVQDKIVIREPERFVQLHIKLNGVSETIICPHDFGDLIHSLQTCSVGAEALRIYGKHSAQMERLGLIRKNARLSWNPTALLHKHADALHDAFYQRWGKIVGMED